MGWNKAQFYGKPNGGKPGEDLGVDIAIMRQYNPSTHGSQSPIMQFCEKYLWCAVHEMLGYLADRLPFYHDSDDGKANEWVSDYSLLINVPNPDQELKVESIDSKRENTGWFLPNQLTPSLKDCPNDCQESITKWIEHAPIPDLTDWIFANASHLVNVADDLIENWTCIFNFTKLTEPKTLTESSLWINSFFIKSYNFSFFKKDCLIQSEHLIKHFTDSTANMHSSPKTDTYMNPSALSWMHWIKDDYERFFVYSMKENELIKYPVYKCLSEVIYSSAEEREFTFSLTSEKIRTDLKIMDGDGWRYWDKDNELVAFFSIAGLRFRDRQTLLYVDKTKLEKAMEEKGFKIFWVAYLRREPSIKIIDKYEKFNYEREITLVLFEEKGRLKPIIVQDDINPW